MTYFIFVACAIAILILFGYVFRRNYELFLCLLLVLNAEFFYILPQLTRISIETRISSDDYKLILIFVILILFLLSVIGRKFTTGRYGLWVLFFVILSVFDVLISSFYGQPVIFGIKAAKFNALVTIYFIVANNELDETRFINYFVVLALTVAALAAVQLIYWGQFNFFIGNPKGYFVERLGQHRINIGSLIIATATVMSFARFRQTYRPFYVIASILLFLELTFVIQTRALIIGVILGLILVHFLSSKRKIPAIIVGLFAVPLFISILYVSPTQWVKEIPLVNYTIQEAKSKEGVGGGRIYQYKYAWSEIEKHPLLGRGVINFNWSGKEKMLREEAFVSLSDIGIMRFFIQAGFAGFIWFLFLLVILWKDIFKFNTKLHLSAYFIVASIVLPTIDMFLRNDALFLFALFLGCLSHSIENDRKSEQIVTKQYESDQNDW